MSVRSGLGFITALWLASRRSSLTPLDTLNGGFKAVSTVLKTLLNRDQRAEREVVQRRLQACSECPIFCHELQTCGDARTVDNEPLGCFCFMPVKARIKDSVCWLREPEQLGPETEQGWPV